MAAQYDLRERPNPKGDGEKQPLYPRLVIRNKISTEQLIQAIDRETTLSAGELLAALRLLQDKIAYYVSEGCKVEFGDMGYFTASIKSSRPVMSKEEIRSTSICFDGINFQAKTKFRKSIQGTLTRARYGFGKSSDISLEKRKKLLKEYFEENIFITRKRYTELTGRLKNLALEDLNKWVEEGYLKKEGVKASRIYLKGDKFSLME